MSMNLPDTSVSSTSTFQELGLGRALLAAISDAGYTKPTAIQSGAIPLLLAGNDIIGQARTGTGKTAAFALPMLEKINVDDTSVQGLILTPTRELAIQITEAMEGYASHRPGLRVLSIYGGQSFSAQLRELHHGVHVVVGTPGRILDHLRRQTLKLDSVQSLVLDEADEMLRMGFIEDVEAIIAQTPVERRTALFSATMPRAIESIARKHLNAPQKVTIASTAKTTIEQRFIRVRNQEKFMVLDRLLRASDHEGVLIFAQRRVDTEQIAKMLNQIGHSAEALNGDLSQQQREKVVGRLRDRTLNIVVGTDVAARGLDVDHLSMVINYDVPGEIDTYTHRIGRTGRAGREGIAISLVSGKQLGFLRRIEAHTKQPIVSMPVPTIDEITHLASERHKARIRALLTEPEKIASDQFELVKSLVSEGYHMTQVAAAASILAAGDAMKLPTRADLMSLQARLQPEATEPARDNTRNNARKSRKPSRSKRFQRKKTRR